MQRAAVGLSNSACSTWRRRARGSPLAAAAISAAARIAYSDLAPLVVDMAAAGNSLRAIAAALNEHGHTTRTGRPWNPVQVGRVLKAAA